MFSNLFYKIRDENESKYIYNMQNIYNRNVDRTNFFVKIHEYVNKINNIIDKNVKIVNKFFKKDNLMAKPDLRVLIEYENQFGLCRSILRTETATWDLKSVKTATDSDSYGKYLEMEKRVPTSIIINGKPFFKNYNYKTLRSLMRCRGIPQYKKHLQYSSFGQPLTMHLHWCDETDDINMSTIILREIITKLESIEVNAYSIHYYDDIIRVILDEIDSETFSMVHDSGIDLKTIFINICGLASMGGPKSWDEQVIIAKIHDWVTGEYEWDVETTKWVHRHIEKLFGQWSLNKLDRKLTYKEYVTDPMRWATSGGAPSVRVKGLVKGNPDEDEQIRSKWAWILEHMSTEDKKRVCDIIAELRKAKITAGVATKDEAKTRIIITTPMASYVRQCYIMYAMGEPNFLRSTIVTKDVTEKIISGEYKQFVCIDASKFDHNIPKSLILKVFSTILDVALRFNDTELQQVVLEEIDHIVGLSVDYNGVSYKYQKGLLSGWRFTSFIGTLVTNILCDNIKEKLKIPCDYITQGDDIIMLLNERVDPELILNVVAEFGIVTNSKKTTIGTSGEFLKYVYYNNMAFGYTARCVRSIFYANPWLDPHSVTSASSISMKWFVYLSRLCSNLNKVPDIDKFLDHVAHDINKWLGNKKRTKRIKDMLRTPTSLGGLGIHETCDYESSEFVSMNIRNMDEDKTAKTRIFGLFGVTLQGMRMEEKIIDIKKMSISVKQQDRLFRQVYNSVEPASPMKEPDDINIFKSMLGCVTRLRKSPQILKTMYKNTLGQEFDYRNSIPALGGTRRWHNVLRILLQKDEVHMPNSCFLDNRYDSALNKFVKSVSTTIFISNKFNSNKYQYLLPCFCIKLFCDTKTYFHSL